MKKPVPSQVVQYTLTLKNSPSPDGVISLERLAVLAQGIVNIAKGALQIRLSGLSHKKGKAPAYLEKALNIQFKGIQSGSTIIQLEAPKFSDTIPPLEAKVAYMPLSDAFLNKTPISLFVDTYQEALTDAGNQQGLDKALIQDLKVLQGFFRAANEELVIATEASNQTLSLTKGQFDKIKQLDEATPEPQQVLVNGTVDVLEYSKSKLTLVTNGGKLTAIFSDEEQLNQARPFWGLQVTLAGQAHFKSNGQLMYVLVDRIFESRPQDKFFSKVPNAENARQQLKRQIRERTPKNWMAEIAGKWPGNETDKEFEEMLKLLD